MIAKIIANLTNANFIPIKGPEVFSKWFGESEQRIRQIFQKARECSPTIIFFDEIDAMTSQRGVGQTNISDSIVNQLLAEMDGIQSSSGVYIIAATNRKDLIDPALLRPGRFDYHLLVPLPNEEGRSAIFKIHLKNKPLQNDIQIEELVKKTNNFSGSHIAEVCRRAGMFALIEAKFQPNDTIISRNHLYKAIDVVGESIRTFEKRDELVEVM
jgi:transitional endoplasmic reticulum ATPase